MGLCFNLTQAIRNRKRVLFFVAIIYVVFMLVVYQGYSWKVSLFNMVNRGVVVIDNKDSLQKTIRYIFSNPGNSTSGNTSASITKSHFGEDVVLDIHIDDPQLGHTGEVIGGHNHSHSLPTPGVIRIAIGGGITSKKLKDITEANIPTKFQVFTTLLPSFCKTASTGFDYHFYFAYDDTDSFFTNLNMVQAFQKHFHVQVEKMCSAKKLKPSIHFVQCSHHGSPAWAQNDAMVEAYLDDLDYYYRVNDDSILETSGWTEAFIKVLGNYDPKNVGVVGPKHQGGNMVILTYDFTHKTHLDMFGFYYPRLFKDWWADDWVTKVYLPGRSTKLKEIKLRHTMKLGQRYAVTWVVGKQLSPQLHKDRRILDRYLSYKKSSKDMPPPNGTLVISMSLYGRNPNYTMGAIRNAQLTPVHFPGWVLRVYVAQVGSNTNPEYQVPQRILNKLLSLGAQIAYVNASQKIESPKLWRYLVADDVNVKYFVIRNTDERLSDRDYDAVRSWINKHPDRAFHCLRDHPSHATNSVIDGLWGAQTDGLRRLMPVHMGRLLQKDLYTNETQGHHAILTKFIWPLVRDHSLCHDSVSCNKWPHSMAFPNPRGTADNLYYIGEKYSSHHNPADLSALKNLPKPPECLPATHTFPPLDIDIHNLFSKQQSLSSVTLASGGVPSSHSVHVHLNETAPINTNGTFS